MIQVGGRAFPCKHKLLALSLASRVKNPGRMLEGSFELEVSLNYTRNLPEKTNNFQKA